MDDDTLLAVCRTTYDRVWAATGGSVDATRDAIRVELERAGFTPATHDREMMQGANTVFAMLADGRYVRLDRQGNWQVHRYQRAL